jgi:multiple sugar transport system substrate-binding protein
MKKYLYTILALTIVISTVMLGVGTNVAKAQRPYEGVKLVVAAMTGPQISGPVETHRGEWEEMTGATVEVQTFAFGDLYEKIHSSFVTGVHAFDIIIWAPNWSGDIMGPGYVTEVPEEVKAKMDWDDIVPVYRERLLTWGGKLYALPYDGDAHMLYFRKDILEDPDNVAAFEEQYGYPLGEPQTWTEYRDIAEFFNGTEWQGSPLYGAVEAQKRRAQSAWTLMSRAGAYAKHPDNPSVFFDEDTMEPLVNNPAWVRALEDYVEITSLGPPGMVNYDIGDVRMDMGAGNAVLAVDWADIGTISIDPTQSVVKGLLGFGMLPGSYEVYNYRTGEWETFDEPSHAPFLAFGGWSISVTATSENPEAAFDFAAFMGSKDMSMLLNVTPFSGVNPSRYSHFENIDAWVAAGFDEESARDYLGAIRDSIDHPNVVLDIRVPGYAEYYEALDLAASQAVAGATPRQALDECAKTWNEITDRLGREQQLKYYRESLGLPAEAEAEAAGGYTIVMVPKFTGADYFIATQQGGQTAADELGDIFEFTGTIEADVDGEIEIIDNLITRGVDALVVSANDPDAIVPVLKRAQEAGIPVVTYDADANGGRDFFVNQASFDAVGKELVDVVAEEAGEDAKYTIVSATATAANQNAWIAAMEAYMAEAYPDMEILDIRYGNDDTTESRRQAEDLINTYPDMDAIVAPTSVAFPAVADAVEEAGLAGEIVITGLATPNGMREFVHRGTVTTVVLWNPVDLGYLGVYAAHAILVGELEPGDTSVEAGHLGSKEISGDEILLGPAYRFTIDNIDDFNF